MTPDYIHGWQCAIQQCIEIVRREARHDPSDVLYDLERAFENIANPTETSDAF